MRQNVSSGITSECRNTRPRESRGSGPVELRCNEGKSGRITKVQKRKRNVDRTNERRTHSARLIRKGDHDLSFPASVGQLIPLFLWCAHIVEIGREPDSAHVDIVAHVICNAVTATFRFVGTEVALKRDLRISRDVTRTTYASVLNYNDG